MFILKQKKNTSSTNLLFPEKLLSQSLRITCLFSICIFKWEMHGPQLLVFPRNKIFQNIFSLSTHRPQYVKFRVDTKNLITVDSKENQTNNSFGYLKCSNPNKMPSNAVATFESTRLKTRLFLNTVSTSPIQTMMCLKAKSLSKNETLQPIGKVIKKILIHKQNYA